METLRRYVRRARSNSVTLQFAVNASQVPSGDLENALATAIAERIRSDPQYAALRATSTTEAGSVDPDVAQIMQEIRRANLPLERIRELYNWVGTLQEQASRPRPSSLRMAFGDLSEAIEEVSEKLTSAEYKRLYDTAARVREAMCALVKDAAEARSRQAREEEPSVEERTWDVANWQNRAVAIAERMENLGLVFRDEGDQFTRPLRREASRIPHHWSMQGGVYGYYRNGLWRPVTLTDWAAIGADIDVE